MSTYYLAASRGLQTQPLPPSREMIPTLSLESMDGSKVIRLDGTMGWIRMPGSTGLEMAPTEVIRNSIPGVAGSLPVDVRMPARPIFIPLYGRSDTGQRSFFELLDQIRALINPLNGSFKVVGSSVRGVRELVVTYDGGFEGADGQDVHGLSWCKIGLRATADQPFARARKDTRLEFRAAEAQTPFLGIVGGTDAPWPGFMTSSAVIGDGMRIPVFSEVPVFPKLELVGAMNSFSSTLTSENGDSSIGPWSVDVPLGVPAGSKFVMVTDPRTRSVRLDGALAAGRVALGSAVYPLQPGGNTLNVAAPGGTVDTRVVISWRDLFWSLW